MSPNGIHILYCLVNKRKANIFRILPIPDTQERKKGNQMQSYHKFLTRSSWPSPDCNQTVQQSTPSDSGFVSALQTEGTVLW